MPRPFVRARWVFMRVAIQTLSWGRQPDVGQMLADVAAVGYAGVELAQHPDVLGPADELHARLTGLGLVCLGLSGGSLDEKCRYMTRYSTAILLAKLQGKSAAAAAAGRRSARPSPYLYVDEWEGQRSVEALVGNTLALHPHMFKSFQTAREAEELLTRYPDLWLLPDTAHLTVAGEDVIGVLNRNFDRIIAVHLKDWTAEYGRAYHFYSRGFVELGRGDVRPAEVIRFLQLRGYQDWIVVEQDSTTDPVGSARASREWLQHTCGV